MSLLDKPPLCIHVSWYVFVLKFHDGMYSGINLSPVWACRGEQQPQRTSNFVLGEWQLHILANVPFYSLLLPLLLDLEASRLAAGSRPDSQELLQVPLPLLPLHPAVIQSVDARSLDAPSSCLGR